MTLRLEKLLIKLLSSMNSSCVNGFDRLIPF